MSELQAHPGSFQNKKEKNRIDLTPLQKRKTLGGQKPVILTLYVFPIVFLFFPIFFLLFSYFFLIVFTNFLKVFAIFHVSRFFQQRFGFLFGHLHFFLCFFFIFLLIFCEGQKLQKPRGKTSEKIGTQ